MIIIIRFLFILGCTLYGFLSEISWLKDLPIAEPRWVAAGIGFMAATLVLCLDVFFKRYTVKNILSVLIGLGLGLAIHKLFMMVVEHAGLHDVAVNQLAVISAIVFSYLGAITILRGQEEFTMMIPFVTLDTKSSGEELILLDTSVIIDGRISDIAKTHFISGKLILPRFVLKELQLISDSSDPMKRTRGRRGLDVLNKMKANPNIQVRINEIDFPEINTVDAKLVKMAQGLNAKVFTNDFNLNKVAELQGVKVLNINELANALKPIVMPGEIMQAKIIKDGKEHDQGVAYLDDGTMVVVDNGRRRIGQTLNVIITSVLQTQAGRMIFARLAEDQDRGDKHSQRSAERYRQDSGRRHQQPNHSGGQEPTAGHAPQPSSEGNH